MGALIFVSYATEDAERFQIREIAERLTKLDGIDNVLYWQEDLKDDIFEYMNDSLERCDAFLLFCSENAKKSRPVALEWRAALSGNKKIIPIFQDELDIPVLLKPKLGVRFNPLNLNDTIGEIYEVFLKKLSEDNDSHDLSTSKGDEIENINVKDEIIFFREGLIYRSEVDLLQELEIRLGIEFRLTSEIDQRTKGCFSVLDNRITGISLSHPSLKSLPKSIGRLKSLERLYLSNCGLTALPNSLDQLEALKELDLSGNKIQGFHSTFFKLKSLRYLNLSRTQLTSLPESIRNFNALETLILNSNQLWTLPESIGELNSLHNLQIDRNVLMNLPESFITLKSLKLLFLSKNRLTSFPKAITHFQALKRLNICDNKITSIPETVLNLPELEIFDIRGNPLDQKSKSLLIDLRKKGVRAPD